MNITNMKKLVTFCWNAGKSMESLRRIPIFFWGPAGVGKTQATGQVAADLRTREDREVVCINIKLAQLEPGDLIGIPVERDTDAIQKSAFDRFCRQKAKEGLTDPVILMREFEESVGKAMVWLEPDWWPDEEAIIFLDEYNRMQPITANCVLELVNEHRVHTHRLPPGCMILAAANPVTDEGNYMVNMVDDAHMGRFCHIKIVPTKEEWIEWASATGKFHHNVLSFLGIDDSALGNLNIQYKLDINRQPRTWEMFNDMIMAGLPDDLIFEVGTGLVGLEFATSFRTYIKNDEKPLSAEAILGWSKKTQGKVKKWSDKNNGRPDLLAVSGNILTGYLKKDEMEGGLKKKEAEALLKYLKSVPADSGFAIVKSLVRVEWVHDVLRTDEKLYKRLEEASREARAA